MKERFDFSDILISPDVVSYIPSREVPRLANNQNDTLPLSIANMENIGTLHVASKICAAGWKVYIDKHTSLHEWHEFIKKHPWEITKNTIPTFGLTERDMMNAKELHHLLVENYGNVDKTICFDFANGHIVKFWHAVSQFLNIVPYTNLIIGNFGNPNVISPLVYYFKGSVKIKSLGLKFGLGSGSVCTTRLVTGVGYPQYSLIQEARHCLDEISKNEEMKIYIISDGGIRNSGDIVKAFVAGAHEVMMGGIFAGLTETTKHLYGSSSERSQSYMKSTSKAKVPEGKYAFVENKNMSIHNFTNQLENGIRSAMTYLNAESVDDIINNPQVYQALTMVVRRQTDNY